MPTLSMYRLLENVKECHLLKDQQLSKFLLLFSNWVPGEIPITQETISYLLGVRRETVTAAAYKLFKAGVINYERGHIHILDFQALEEQSCECYHAIKTALNCENKIPTARTLQNRSKVWCLEACYYKYKVISSLVLLSKN